MLYNLLSGTSFIQKAVRVCWDYCVKNPALAIIAGVLCLALLGLIIAIPCVAAHRKKKKATWEAEQAKIKAEEETQTTEEVETEQVPEATAPIVEAAPVVETKPTIEPAPIAEEKPAVEVAPIAEEKLAVEVAPVVEEKPAVEPAPVVEEKPAVEPAPVVETKPAVAVAPVEEKPSETPVQPVPAPIEPQNTAAQAQEQTTENAAVAEPKQVQTKQKKYTGKWVIFHVVTDDEKGGNKDEDLYFFELHASNGEKLLSSEEYTSYAGAVRGIETHKKNILAGNFRITLSKKGHYIFKLLSGKNTLLCTGENYPSKMRCEKALESTKRFAETAVLDENTRELFIKLPPEDDAPIAALPDGCTGKWIIASHTGEDGETVYYFELLANNGEKLLSSEEYSSYIGAVNGIETHKKNISAGNFRIVLTKRGDYIYKLLNGNGQLLCLGEHYKTRKRCQNAVESVQRFAFNSPVLTSEKTKKN